MNAGGEAEVISPEAFGRDVFILDTYEATAERLVVDLNILPNTDGNPNMLSSLSW